MGSFKYYLSTINVRPQVKESCTSIGNWLSTFCRYWPITKISPNRIVYALHNKANLLKLPQCSSLKTDKKSNWIKKNLNISLFSIILGRHLGWHFSLIKATRRCVHYLSFTVSSFIDLRTTGKSLEYVGKVNI